MKFNIITAFPKAFSYFEYGILRIANEKANIAVNLIDLRDFGMGKWKKIDDKPFGGGAGMLLTIEPLYKALKSLKIQPEKKYRSEDESIVVLTSPKGTNWTQKLVREWSSRLKEITIICGHYEGVDERVVSFCDFEISVGNFILSGGELGAMILVDSLTRLIPDTLGNELSAKVETEFLENGKKIKEYPQYTRPRTFLTDNGTELSTPDYLLSGNHKIIQEKNAEGRTLV